MAFVGCLPHKIEVVSNIHNLTNWILDCVLDKKMGLSVPALDELSKVLFYILCLFNIIGIYLY